MMIFKNDLVTGDLGHRVAEKALQDFGLLPSRLVKSAGLEKRYDAIYSDGTSAEYKTDCLAQATSNICVEFEKKTSERGIYEGSGITTSEATHWCTLFFLSKNIDTSSIERLNATWDVNDITAYVNKCDRISLREFASGPENFWQAWGGNGNRAHSYLVKLAKLLPQKFSATIEVSKDAEYLSELYPQAKQQILDYLQRQAEKKRK